MGMSKHTGRHMRGIQRYRGYPIIWGHPNIQGASKCMGSYEHPLSLKKACFLCVVYVKGASKHMGGTTFLYNPELYLPSCFFFLILNILSIFFFKISLSFALCVDRNSLLSGVWYIVLYFARCCCKISFPLKNLTTI